MNNDGYNPPVSRLITCGRKLLDTPMNYASLDLNQTHIPELIRMLADEQFYSLDEPDCYASIHAARALGELKAVEAIDSLIAQLYRIDEYGDDWITDWILSDYIQIFAQIGKECIPVLAQCLYNDDNNESAQLCAVESLEYIGQNDEEQRLACIDVLVSQLKYFVKNDATLNAFIISSLSTLKALETLDLVREAFNQNCVDISVCGDLEDVEMNFGIRSQRDTPKPDYWKDLADIDEIREGLENFKAFHRKENSFQKIEKVEKIGRNEPCPCGSGKKYKKCCLN